MDIVYCAYTLHRVYVDADMTTRPHVTAVVRACFRSGAYGDLCHITPC